MDKPRRVRRKILKRGKIKKIKKNNKKEPKVNKDERKDIYTRIIQMHPEKKDSLFVLAITRRRTNHIIVRKYVYVHNVSNVSEK